MGGYNTDGAEHSHQSDSSGDWEKQCWTCKKWFFSASRWIKHYRRRNSGCEKHKICFAWEENYSHAKDKKLDRYFMRDCDSDYATEGGWTDWEIRAHVKDEHTSQGSESSGSESD